MVAKVLIKRRFVKGNTPEIVALLNQLRGKAMHQPGYVSGVIMVGYENHQVFMVIGTWQSMHHWFQWKESEERRLLESQLEVYQEGPTDYEEYVLGPPPTE